MNDDYILQTAKIVTRGKIPGRELRLKTYKPTNPFDAKLGDLYFLLEIKSTLQNGELIFRAIEECMVLEFYKETMGSHDIGKRFENAIKAVNLALSEKARDGETEWIGNLSAIIVLIHEEDIFFSSSGGVEAYLFRENKISHLTEDENAYEKAEPGKTFSSVTAGALGKEDKIIIANSELYDHISLDSLRQEFGEAPPNAVAAEVAAILRKGGIQNISALFIKTGRAREFEKVKRDLPETVYLDGKGAPIFETTFKAGKAFGSTMSKGKPIMRQAAIRVGFTTMAIGKFAGKVFQKKEKTRKMIKEDDRQPAFVGRSMEFSVGGAGANRGIDGFFAKFFAFLKEKRRILYIVLAVLLIALLVLGIVIKRKNIATTEGPRQALEVLNKARSDFDGAKNQVALHNEEEAKRLLISAQKSLEGIKNETSTISEVNSLLSDIQNELDSINKVRRVALGEPLGDFGSLEGNSNITQIELSKQTIYALNNASGSIFSLNEADKQAKIVSNLPKTSGLGQVVDSTYVADKDTIIIMTDQGGIFEFSPKTTDITKKTTSSGNFNKANFLTSYLSNIYLLSKNDGQIYKYTRSGDNFGKVSNYLGSASNFSKVVDITIDGSIYILSSDGGVTKIASGKVTSDFKADNLPTPDNKVSDAKALYTDTSAKNLWLLDGGGKRIIEYDKAGKFVQQYKLPDDISDPKDIVVNEKLSALYLLAGTKVYKIGL